jgi:nonsense-mediated mRNA decay protein 3
MVMAPLCKDDLVVLPRRLAHQLGNICPLVVIERVTSLVHIVDPASGERQFFDIEAYGKAETEFKALMSAPQLVEYVVLGCEPMVTTDGPRGSATGGGSNRLAMLEVARTSDLGR